MCRLAPIVLDRPGAAELAWVGDEEVGRESRRDSIVAERRGRDEVAGEGARGRGVGRQRVDEGRVGEEGVRVVGRRPGRRCRLPGHEGQHDRQWSGTGIGTGIAEMVAATSGDIGEKVGLGELKFVEESVLDQVDLDRWSMIGFQE